MAAKKTASSPTPTAAPVPPAAPPVLDRQLKTAYVRNLLKQPIGEVLRGGERVIIEPGRIGIVGANRVGVLGGQVKEVTAADYESQEKGK